MGKLKIEPKVKAMDQKKYREISNLLKEAQAGADGNHLYYDLEKNENGGTVAKDLRFVADKEGIPLKVRRLRKTRSLSLEFGGSDRQTERISADDYKKILLNVLSEAKGPMKKADILEKAKNLSAGTWHFRIGELVKDGLVKRKGTRQAAVYTLIKKK